MQPQDPYAPGVNPQPQLQPQQPLPPQASAYAPQPAPMPQQPALPQQPVAQQVPPAYPQPAAASSLPLPIISLALSALAVVLFGVFFGIAFAELKYYLYLISLVVAAGGVVLGMKSLKNSTGAVDILALSGLVVGLVAVSLSLSFTVGQAIQKQKYSDAASSYSSE